MRTSNSSGAIRILGMGMGIIVLFNEAAAAPAARQLEPYRETIAGTVVGFDMMPVPGGTVTIADPEAPGGERAVEVSPLWMGKTEVTWDEFDVWLLGLDTEPERRTGIDAESRPSRPYGAPDRGFGQNPVLSPFMLMPIVPIVPIAPLRDLLALMALMAWG